MTNIIQLPNVPSFGETAAGIETKHEHRQKKRIEVQMKKKKTNKLQETKNTLNYEMRCRNDANQENMQLKKRCTKQSLQQNAPNLQGALLAGPVDQYRRTGKFLVGNGLKSVQNEVTLASSAVPSCCSCPRSTCVSYHHI